MKRERIKRGFGRVGGALAAAAVVCSPSGAQTHKVAKPENVVRAVGVYEWTGDMTRPTASRLIPVTLYIDQQLQDADVYLAQPVPMALLTGNLYELQKSGVPVGDFDLRFARHLVAPESATTTYDDGWFGYGKFMPPALPKRSNLKGHAVEVSLDGLDEDESTPHFSARSAKPGSGGAATPTPGSMTAAADNPPGDPDRPTLHRAAEPAAAGGTGTTPADDPDRPTLRRRTPVQAKAAQDASGEIAGNTLNDDPNRPRLHRGKPPDAALTDADIPKLVGLPPELELHQMVAVSDAADRPEHDFSRTWEGDDERQAILMKMEAQARTLLTAYEAANAPAAAKAAKPAAHTTAHAAGRGSQDKAAPAPAPEPLKDEQLTGYTLSYGGAATFVYHARTVGVGPSLQYVTLVAQVNMQGEPEIALKNVTDAAHLDRTPQMRLVDAVDAEASNRASLLFELRGQNSRQFALYRVIGGQATQIFVTGLAQ